MTAQVVFALAGWFAAGIAAALLVCALAWFFGDRPYTQYAAATPAPAPRPSIPAQRVPVPAAVIVDVADAQSFDEFLLELILTPHVEEVLS